MKRFWDSWLYFTHRERKGIRILLALLALLYSGAEVYRYLSTHSDAPPLSAAQQAEWDLWLHQNAGSDREQHDLARAPQALRPFPFDPNTLDSAGFIALGLPAAQVKSLLNWRRKGKIFRSPEAFAPLRGLSRDQFNTLKPFIRINRPNDYTRYTETELPLTAVLDLNTVDSATLVRVKGIGPYLAQRILQYRESLGSFISNEQLTEIHRFPDSVLQRLKHQLRVQAGSIRRIHLNTADEAQLAHHPYIGQQMAKNIILLRKGLGKYEDREQLRQVPLMNEEKYRKIAPYCIIE